MRLSMRLASAGGCLNFNLFCLPFRIILSLVLCGPARVIYRRSFGLRGMLLPPRRRWLSALRFLPRLLFMRAIRVIPLLLLSPPVRHPSLLLLALHPRLLLLHQRMRVLLLLR